MVIKIGSEGTVKLYSPNRKSVSMGARIKIAPKIPSNADQLYFKVSGFSWLADTNISRQYFDCQI